MKKVIIIVGLLFIVSTMLFGATVSGVVVNKANGQPIEYANVIIKETEQGTLTNHKGYFVLTGIKPGKYTLFVSCVGYQTITSEVRINSPKEDTYSKFELVKKNILLQGTRVTAKAIVEEVNTPQIRISALTQSTAQIQDNVSVGEPDVLRSIISLPGVTPISDFSSGMYVRGGSPDQNLILLDDIDVYNPNHFGGIFSTFNTDAVDNIELLKGGFPAKYGERLSSVLNVRNRDGNRNEFEGVSRLSFISASTTVEGPWNIGDQSGSFMGSYRRSYVDLIAQAIDNIPDYYFYDGHAKVNYDLDAKNKLSLSTYFGKDVLEMNLGPKMTIDWGNKTFTAQLVHIFSPKLFSHFILAGSTFESNMGMKTEGGSRVDRINKINDLTFKSLMSYTTENNHYLEFGFENKYNNIIFKLSTNEDYDPETTPNVSTDAITSSVYFQDSWDINVFWSLQTGLRISNHQTIDSNLPASPKANYSRVSPRVTIRRKIDLNSNVYFSYGRYYQYLTLVSAGMSTPFDIWFPLDKTVKPGESDHYILGYKREIMQGLGFDVETYYKTYNNLNEYRSETDYEWSNSNGTLGDIYNMGEGRTFGLDLLLRNDIYGVSGFVGYTISSTQRKIDNYNLNPYTNKPEYFYPKYDKTHSLSIVENYNLTQNTGIQLWGADIKFGANYTLSSGQPDPIPEKIYYDGTNFHILDSYADRVRLPVYSRFDLSFKLQWYKKSYSIEPYIQIINLFNRGNIWTRTYYVETNEENTNFVLKHADSTMFPFMPFLGVDIKW